MNRPLVDGPPLLGLSEQVDCEHHWAYHCCGGEPLDVGICTLCGAINWTDLRRQHDAVRQPLLARITELEGERDCAMSVLEMAEPALDQMLAKLKATEQIQVTLNERIAALGATAQRVAAERDEARAELAHLTGAVIPNLEHALAAATADRDRAWAREEAALGYGQTATEGATR